MKLARLHWIAYSALALNVALVLTTGLSAHFGQETTTAGDSQATAATDGEKTQELPTRLPDATPSLPTELPSPARVAENGGNTSESEIATPLESTLPRVPSLEQVSPDVESDPVFQEIKKMFSEKGGMLETPPMLDSLSPTAPETDAEAEASVAPSREYFARLDGRITTSIKLCESARDVARQAAEAAERGDASQSAEFLKMATQLREMAASMISQSL